MGTMRVDKGGSRTVTPPVQQAPQAVQQGLEAAPPASQSAAFKKAVAKASAQPIIKDLSAGKSIEVIANARRLSPELVIKLLDEADYAVTVTYPQRDNGDIRTTKIYDLEAEQTAPQYYEYYDFQHDSYYIEVKAPGSNQSLPRSAMASVGRSPQAAIRRPAR